MVDALSHPRTQQPQVDSLLECLLDVLSTQHSLLFEEFQVKSKNQLERMVECLLNLNKKYQDEAIQAKSMAILRLVCQMWEVKEKVVVEGGIRFCMNALQGTNEALGLNSLLLLETIGTENISNLNEVYSAVQSFYGGAVKSPALSQATRHFLSQLMPKQGFCALALYRWHFMALRRCMWGNRILHTFGQLLHEVCALLVCRRLSMQGQILHSISCRTHRLTRA